MAAHEGDEELNQYDLLKNIFGYDSFREGQETLVSAALEGRDVLGIMPTGAGKSICFQIPALLFEGITIVVSPLISLMKDQVTALNELGIHAAYINSSLTEGQYRKAMENARRGVYKIIYAAPERLLTDSFLSLIHSVEISMLAVDEAHCISHWGQDFRPSYLKIVDFIDRLPKRPVIAAYTATATKEVKEDIACILGLEDPAIVVTGYDRGNLYFAVKKPKSKMQELLDYLRKNQGKSGIIYCNTRKNVDEVYQELVKNGYPAAKYHAGMSDPERKRNQEDFIYDKSPVMAATNAFGMGIDKSNVRFVVHYNMPKDIESYYQEAGRAGRDGEPSECILYYSGQDVVTNQFFIENSQTDADLDAQTRSDLQEKDRERLRKMTFYCFTNECLRDYILRYFGEYGRNYCGNCSNCLGQFETVDVTETAGILVQCVKDCRQRYGINVIIDTVHGANTAKIRQYGMDHNSQYGRLAKVPVHKLRQIMNDLFLNEYLQTTNDTYMIVKLTERSDAILNGQEQVIMKMAKDQEEEAKVKKPKKAGSTGTVLTQKEMTLFEKLRALRMEIARAERVPPYIVFSDKTLTHMCSVRPGTKEEMLTVTGVGQFKYEKYGERFLKCIQEEVL